MNPKDRVALYDKDNVCVSTVKAFDTGRYETAVSHPKYSEGVLIIVQEYGLDLRPAQQGHDKWVKIMTSDPLPERLVDVSTSMIKVFKDILVGDNESNIHVREEEV